MDPFSIAATTLISALSTEAWQQARAAAVALWRCARPEDAPRIEAELTDARALVLTARERGDEQTEISLTEDWGERLRQLVGEMPDLELQLLRSFYELRPVPMTEPERRAIGTVTLKAEGRDNAQIYQAVGNQIFHRD
ncbi:hypothetical protein [Streptomyces sp. NPDC048282]|uniref:hypothetical protein n=1 Tax=Streptomyces sp. NPDC048282 TaxID=3365528 RepID=UPI003711E355